MRSPGAAPQHTAQHPPQCLPTQSGSLWPCGSGGAKAAACAVWADGPGMRRQVVAAPHLQLLQVVEAAQQVAQLCVPHLPAAAEVQAAQLRAVLQGAHPPDLPAPGEGQPAQGAQPRQRLDGVIAQPTAASQIHVLQTPRSPTNGAHVRVLDGGDACQAEAGQSGARARDVRSHLLPAQQHATRQRQLPSRGNPGGLPQSAPGQVRPQ
mmetsp:Transcript_12341/g.31575  ORF Transcript_12341/g.31575 Transcript_12341/m.31575 type:complete len:208 (+) Transcript_12341:289-912(+)